MNKISALVLTSVVAISSANAVADSLTSVSDPRYSLARRAGAIGASIGMLPSAQKDGRWVAGVSTAFYGEEQAMAAGASFKKGGNVFKVGAANDSFDTLVGASVSFQF